MQKEKFKDYVQRKVSQGASSVGRGISGSARYVGRIAGRKLKEGVERTFGEPINPKDREAWNKTYEAERRRYWASKAKREYRERPRSFAPQSNLFGGGNSGISMTGVGLAPTGMKKKKDVSMI